MDHRGLYGKIYVVHHYTLLLTKYISSSGPHGFREDDFCLSFSHYKSMGANDTWGVASLDPRGLIGRINVGDHETLLHTKYVTCRPHGFRQGFFFKFFPLCLWELMTPGAWSVWTPGV